MYKARISITMNFDWNYFDLHDGRVMPPHIAAMIMYNSRTIKNVSTALQWHKTTKKHTGISTMQRYLVNKLEKRKISKFLANPQVHFHHRIIYCWFLAHKIISLLKKNIAEYGAYKSLAFFIHIARLSRLDCFLKWKALSCIVAVLSTRSARRSPLSNIFSILSTMIVCICNF